MYMVFTSKYQMGATTFNVSLSIIEYSWVQIYSNPFRTKTPKYLFPREKEPLLYYQIGNINFFIFITNQ